MAKRAPAALLEPAYGAIEAAVQLVSGDGWLLLGWTSQRWSEVEPAERLYAEHSFGTVTGEARSIFHSRTDVPESCVGFCMVLLGPTLPAARLMSVELPQTGLRLLAATEGLGHEVLAVAARARRVAHAADPQSGLPFLDLLPGPTFDGVESVSKLWPPVHLGLDQAIRVRSDGLALAGSLIDTGKSIARITVHGGGRRVALDRSTWLTVRRPDLMKDFATQFGLDDDRIGFLAYVPGVAAMESPTYIEIETTSGEFGFKPFRVFESRSLGVIKQFLSVPPPPSSKLNNRFDHGLGPIIEGLVQTRPTPRPAADLVFGPQPVAPAVSVIIPLYGRIDFMEMQLALFSERPGSASELIYVLDDPSLEEAAERLALSCWVRFKLPFRLLILPENGGFAAANNAGLRAAAGKYICMLNSDVFPQSGDGLTWLDALTVHLERDPALGAVGPRLLFGDGTVQHHGMHYERQAEFADWWFPIHTDKGAAARPETALRRVTALTGACMMVRKSELMRAGGLDEGYVIGDFEDADLCQRFAADGKSCAVDPSQNLFHMERQSQGAGNAWRTNATLYNAWRFNRRWEGRIGAADRP